MNTDTVFTTAVTIACAVITTLVIRHEVRAARAWRHGYAVGRRVGLAQASEGQGDETVVAR